MYIVFKKVANTEVSVECSANRCESPASPSAHASPPSTSFRRTSSKRKEKERHYMPATTDLKLPRSVDRLDLSLLSNLFTFPFRLLVKFSPLLLLTVTCI